jgi:SNF2 family DNA or RNA helicase
LWRENKKTRKQENKMNSVDQRFAHYLRYSGLQQNEYQAEGVRWCVANEMRSKDKLLGEEGLGFGLGLGLGVAELRGGIVADEMGLGKTILMIGTMVANILPNTLIIVPPVLIEQWRQQIRKTTGYEPLVYHGAAKKTIDVGQLLAARIVVASYGAISIRKGGKSLLLHNIVWSRVVFDEAHHLRNGGARFVGACELKADIRWLVTGTPIQNRKKDFYNLCEVLGLSRSFYTDFELLRANASSFILKRTKKQVGIQMTDIVNEKTMVPWTNSREQELFEEVHSRLKFSGVGLSADRVGIDRISNGIALTNMIRARQVSVMPKLLAACMTRYEQDHYAEGLTAFSKLGGVVASILANRDNGAGKLVFCMFKEEIDEVCARLLAGGMTKVARLDGRTGRRGRAAALTEKNDALVMQIQTGCEGLNLQENYSEIYFVSPHWNPAVEDQAVARCHRIGQMKDVVVRRFVSSTFSKGGAKSVVSASVATDSTFEKVEPNEEEVVEQVTIEGHVSKVQDRKRFLADQILGSTFEKVEPNEEEVVEQVTMEGYVSKVQDRKRYSAV